MKTFPWLTPLVLSVLVHCTNPRDSHGPSPSEVREAFSNAQHIFADIVRDGGSIELHITGPGNQFGVLFPLPRTDNTKPAPTPKVVVNSLAAVKKNGWSRINDLSGDKEVIKALREAVQRCGISGSMTAAAAARAILDGKVAWVPWNAHWVLDSSLVDEPEVRSL